VTLAILFHGSLAGCNSTYIAKGNGGAGGAIGVGGGGVDAGSPDAQGGQCVSVTVGALPDGGGPACPYDAGCYPGDVTKFSPQPIRPLVANAPHANACNTTQISGWYSSCVSQGGNCQAWLGAAANAKCASCLVTPHTATKQGAVLTYTGSGAGVFHMNVWGCLKQLEPCNASCAEALQAASDCADTACNPESGPCLIHDQASLDAYDTCSSAAPACGCTVFNDIAVSCKNTMVSASQDHPAVATCALDATTLQETYTKVATFLCGP
jgi:hypothetical protein